MPIDEFSDILVRQESREPLDILEHTRKQVLKTRLQTNAVATRNESPDELNDVIALSKKFNVAPSIAKKHFDQLSKTDALSTSEYDRIIDKNPGLSRYMANAENFRLSKDDLPSLERLSDSYHSLFEKKKERGLLDVSKELWDHLMVGTSDMLANAYSFAHMLDVVGDQYKPSFVPLRAWSELDILPEAQTIEVIAKLKARANRIRERQPDFIKDFNQDLANEGVEVDEQFSRFVSEAPNALWEGRIIDALQLYGDAGALTIGEAISMVALLPKHPLASFNKAVEQLPNSAVIIGSGGFSGAGAKAVGQKAFGRFLTKQFGVKALPRFVRGSSSVGTFMGTFPVEGGGTIMEELQKRGVDTSDPNQLKIALQDPHFKNEAFEKALLKSTFLGATQAATHFFAGRRFRSARQSGSSRLSKARALGLDIVEQQFGEALEETVGEIAKEKGDITKIDPSNILQEFMFSWFQSTGESVIGAVGDSVRGDLDPSPTRAAMELKDQAIKASKAINDAEVLQEMADQTKNSKTGKRDPDKLAEILDEEGESENPTNILFQIDEFNEYFSDQGIAPVDIAEDLLGDEDIKYYHDAQATGELLEIPLKKLISRLGNTQHLDNLIPLAKTDVDGMSLIEARDFMRSLRPTLDQIANEVSGDPVQAQIQRSSQSIKRDIKQQLQNINILESDAESASEVLSGFYRTQGERLGVDPLELFNETSRQFVREGVNLTPEKVQEIVASAQETLKERKPRQLFQLPEGFEPTPGLSPVQQSAEATIETVLTAPDAVDRYNALPDAKGGKVLNADLARELSPDFTRGRDGRVVHTASTVKPASRFIQKRFDEKIKSPPQGFVSWTAGGPGSGKSFVVDAVFGEEVDNSEFVVDGTLANLKKNKANIRKALKSGRPAHVFFVYTPILEAARNALGRFKDKGRPVPPRPFTEDHINSIDSFLEIVEEFQGVEGFEFSILSNENRNISALSLDQLKDLSYTKGAGTFDSAFNELLPQVEEILDEQTKEVEEKTRQAQGAFQARALEGRERIRQSGVREGQEGVETSRIRDRFLFQDKEQKGFVTPFGFFDMDTKTVGLLKGASLETLLEEMLHLATVDFVEFSSRENASPDQKKDLETLLEFAGVQNPNQLDRKHWELLAKAMEKYVAEGKAPTKGLNNAFRQLKNWIVAAYRHLRNLNVELTPEVRGVFDRMLATDREISEAMIEMQADRNAASPESLGMTDRQAERDRQLAEESLLQAKESMNSKLMKDYQRRPWRYLKSEEVTELRQEISQELDRRTEFIAASVLRTGKTPNGVKASNIKLNRKAVVDEYGEKSVRGLPKGIFSSTGVTADFAANFFGYNDTLEFLGGLQFTTKRSAYLNAEIDRRLQVKYGDMLRSEELPEEALDSIHNDKRAQLLRHRLEVMAQQDVGALGRLIKRATRRPIRASDEIRKAAESQILQTKPRDLKPHKYLTQERKFGREAGEALARGNIEESTRLREQELLHFELYRQARNKQKDTEKAVRYLRKFNQKPTRERVGKAGGTILSSIDGLLENYELKQSTTLKEIDRRSQLRKYIQDQRDNGNEPIIPESVLLRANQINYKDVPIQELLDLETAVRSLEHQALTKNKLLALKEERDQAKFIDLARASISKFFKLNKKPIDLSQDLRGKLLSTGEKIVAEHTRLEFLFRFLDGDKANGFFHRNFFQPVADAEDANNNDFREVVTNLNRITNSRYSKKERAQWVLDTIYIPELDDTSLRTPIVPNLTKGQVLAVALNRGNAYNLQALMEGYGWDMSHVDAILSHMQEKDWDFVVDIWKYIDTFWPRVAKLSREVTGVIPAKVEADSFTLPNGRVIPGGYYPLVADSRIDNRTLKLEEKEQVQDLMGGQWARAMTAQGHTKERQNFGGKPVKLELSVLENHITNVIHDLNHRKVVIDLVKLIENDDIKELIELSAGKEMYKQLKPWIRAVANDRRMEPPNTTERLLSKLRSNATVVYLGFKATSAVLQSLGYINTVKEIGPKYSFIGFNKTFQNPLNISKTWKFITSRSPMMRDRPSNMDRDVRDALRKLGFLAGERGVLAASKLRTAGLTNAYFSMISSMDLFVSVPTWLGAYAKAMDGKVDGIQLGDENAAVNFADSTVRRSQAAGAAKDLANIQRGSEAWKLFTMFYTEGATKANQLIFAFENFKINKPLSENVTKLVVTLGLVWFLQSAMEGLLRGDVPDPEEEPEKFTKWLVSDQFFYPFENFVVARDIASFADFKFNKGFSTAQGSPVFRAYQSFGNTALIPFQLFLTDKELGKAEARSSFETVGFITGAPTSQMWKTGDYVAEFLNGNLGEKNPIQFFWESLVTGVPRE